MNIITSILRRLSDLERRLTNAQRYGTITAVDAANGRAKVTFGGETESAWLPISVARAAGAKVWAPPVAGEQVMIFSPGGDTAQGVICGSLPSDANPSPSSDGAAYTIHMPGGVTINVAGGAIEIVAPGQVKVTGDIIVTGGDVVADGISLKEHIHGGIVRGALKTDPPE
ncbi:phage baseplate assembly protein V [Fuscibacter oryzae]|uniref:Phage baseplate assembly protein V n=1 Tax=Fuscibacter oryzae TaxID=2803939 RepID=A0A8J7MS54_9RHOB|nr:phage baseplate assembly protein V [Fuscibacter oryzae]MBL4929328.1 phage baseplate assembly protein V [Fuscibacter oryzae]